MNRITVGIVLILIIILSSYGGGTAGFSMLNENGQVYVAGGTSLWAILCSILWCGLTWLLYDEDKQEVFLVPVKLAKRIYASVIDIFSIFIFSIGILGIIGSMVEFCWSGTFEWQFARNYSRWTDYFLFIVMIAGWLVMATIYYGYALRNGKQTIGCYIAGTIVIPIEKGKFSWKQAFKRTWTTHVASFGFIFTILIGKNRDGQYWHDEYTRCRVVPIKVRITLDSENTSD